MEQKFDKHGIGMAVWLYLASAAAITMHANAQELTHQIFEAYVFKGRSVADAADLNEGQVVRGFWPRTEIRPLWPAGPDVEDPFYEGYSLDWALLRPTLLKRVQGVDSNLILEKANLMEGEQISVNPSAAFNYTVDAAGNPDQYIYNFNLKVVSFTSRSVPEQPIIYDYPAGIDLDAMIVNEAGEPLMKPGYSLFANPVSPMRLSKVTMEFSIEPYKIPAGSFYVQLSDTSGDVVLRVPVKTGVKDCESCQSGSCTLGASIGSVDINVNLGVGQVSNSPQTFSDSLRFYQESIVNGGISNLSVTGRNAIRTPSGLIQSLESGTQIARVDLLGAVAGASHQDANRFRIRVSSDKSNPDSSIYREITVENVINPINSALQLQVTETLHGRTTVTAYEHNEPSPGVDHWVLETGNGLRRESRTTSEIGDDRIERTVIEERKSSGAYDVVSDVETTTRRFEVGSRVVKTVVDVDGANPQTTSSTYYAKNEESGINGFNSTRGHGLLKQMTLPTGEVETHYYYNLPAADFYSHCHVVKSAFAGQANAKEVTTCSMQGIVAGTGLEITAREIVEKVNGLIVAKSEVSTETDGNTITTETRVYSDATSYQTSFSVSNPFSTTVINPDGTGSLTTVVKNQQENSTTTTALQGYWPTGGSSSNQLVVLTKSVNTTNAEGETIHSESFAYGDDGSEHLVSRGIATSSDNFGRVTQYTHFPANVGSQQFITDKEYACCGLARSSDRTGINTYFTRDALNRTTKVNRLGVTTETVYNGLTTSVHRYPENVLPGGLLNASQANAANEVSRSTRNVLGDEISSWSRTGLDGSLLETTTLTEYNLGNGVGRKITKTYPQTADDQGAIPQTVSEYFTDRRMFRKTGNMGANEQLTYGTNASGVITTRSLLDTDGTTLRESVAIVTDWAGRTVRAEYASDADGNGSNDFTTSEYNAKGQLIRTVDPMGVATLLEYNIKGQVFKRATDINNNGVIDIGTDRIVETSTDFAVGTAPSAGSVSRTTAKVYRDDDDYISAVAFTITRSEQSLDGLRSWTVSYPGTDFETTARSSTTFTGTGSWNTLSIAPDGTSSRSVYSGGLLNHVLYSDRRARELYRQTFGYDNYNRTLTVNDTRLPASSSLTYVSGLVSLPKTSTDAASQVTTFSYDQRNRRTSVDAPDTLDNTGTTIPNVTTTQYFPDGQMRETSGDQTYRRSYTYDYARRMKTLTTYGTATAVTRWVYDSDRGWLTQKLYNSPAEGQGTGPSFTYTANGSLKTRTWARLSGGNALTTTYTYGTAAGSSASDLDAVSYSDASQGYQISQRDLLGRVKTLTDAAGQGTYDYTAHGALEKKAITGVGTLTGMTLEYTHDPRGRPKSMKASHSGTSFHTLNYGYDDAGRLSKVSNDGAQVGYSYHPVKQTLAQQAFQTFSGDAAQTIMQSTCLYDHLNRLKSISYHSTQHAVGGTKPLAHHSYTYNALGQRTRADLMDESHWDYGYNSRGELVKAKHKNKAGADLTGQQYGYSFDGIGNRLGSSDGTSATALANTYTPNVLNQYSSILTSPVKYITGTAPAASTITLNGTATQRQAEYFSGLLNADNTTPLWQAAAISDGTQTTAGNVYIPAATVAPQHDLDGNLTNDGRWIYTWNGENRLIEIQPTAAALTAGMPYAKLKFKYDSMGRRILREQYNSAAATTADQTTKYLYNGWNCIAELNASNNVQRKYAWGTDLSGSMQGAGGVGGLLWVEDETTLEKHFYGYDGNGNVVLIANTATGATSAEYTYTPFGEIIKATGTYSTANRYRFSTKPQETVTGLLYYGHRYYDPITGRWQSRDPVGEAGGVNLYGFIANDSLNFYDYLGLNRHPGQPRWMPDWGHNVLFGADTVIRPAVAKSGHDFLMATDDVRNLGASASSPSEFVYNMGVAQDRYQLAEKSAAAAVIVGTLPYTGTSYVGMAIWGAASAGGSNLAYQSVGNITGSQSGFSSKDFLVSTGAGALGGPLLKAIASGSSAAVSSALGKIAPTLSNAARSRLAALYLRLNLTLKNGGNPASIQACIAKEWSAVPGAPNNVSAKTPVGRTGSWTDTSQINGNTVKANREMNVAGAKAGAPPINTPATIGGRQYSGHALDRMQQRGYVPSVVEDAISSGTKTPSYGGASSYYSSSNNVTVIVDNATGKVVTVRGGK